MNFKVPTCLPHTRGEDLDIQAGRPRCTAWSILTSCVIQIIAVQISWNELDALVCFDSVSVRGYAGGWSLQSSALVFVGMSSQVHTDELNSVFFYCAPSSTMSFYL